MTREIYVGDLRAFVLSLSGTGWFLLPKSLDTVSNQKTAWLARPGFPALIEVQERTDMAAREDRLITSLEIPQLHAFASLISALKVPEIKHSPDQTFWLTFSNGSRHSISNLVAT